MAETAVYLEVGSKKVIASALEWPGWCRSGRNEAEALAALVAAAPRYARIAATAGLPFSAPSEEGDLRVAHRLAGSGSTDFGVPENFAPGDDRPMNAADLARAEAILRGCWHAFDEAAAAAEGKELRKGPRGGGRSLQAIARHVVEAESAYAERVGVKFEWGDLDGLADWREAAAHSRQRVLEALAAAAPVGTPPPGPRGGKRWPARYFARRVAYHVTDHAWEIEDRAA